MIDKKMAISVAIGIAVTFLVYIGLQNSLKVPSLSSTPISSETAVDSDSSSNSIGKYLGKTIPTITTGNHFAWMVKENNHVYFIDSVTGETIT
jgi:hypothetical protein